MSSAVYPLGMRTYPASGYTQKSSFPDQYVTWKGTGLSKTPHAVTAGTVRPLTNKDYGNNFPAPFGKPRPIKHARKGAIPNVTITNTEGTPISVFNTKAEERNINRNVRSSVPNNLVRQMIQNPGGFSVKENTLDEQNPNCGGICVTATLYPNLPYRTENPTATTESKLLCCNEERKARRRSRPAPTKLSKNYYTTHIQYLENRCQTFDQRSFNFVRESEGNPVAKPGAPDANNYYVANCYCPSTSSECGRVYYKPNNYQFAKEGAVSSSALNLRRNVNTINTNISNLPQNQLILKNKSEPCRQGKYVKNGDISACGLKLPLANEIGRSSSVPVIH